MPLLLSRKHYHRRVLYVTVDADAAVSRLLSFRNAGMRSKITHWGGIMLQKWFSAKTKKRRHKEGSSLQQCGGISVWSRLINIYRQTAQHPQPSAKINTVPCKSFMRPVSSDARVSIKSMRVERNIFSLQSQQSFVFMQCLFLTSFVSKAQHFTRSAFCREGPVCSVLNSRRRIKERMLHRSN